MTEDEKAYIKLVKSIVKEGDLLTHTRCLDSIEEHIFARYDGNWMCGQPTKLTKKYGGSHMFANDIAPLNVTHINRQTPGVINFFKEMKS